MGNKVRFKLRKAGVVELFKSPEVNSWLQHVGNQVASTAEGIAQEPDSEYAARAHNAGFTALVNVYPASKGAAHDNYEHNTLLKALGASGLPKQKP